MPGGDQAPVRVGVAGLGQQTRDHLLPALLSVPNVRLSAVVDPRVSVRDDLGDRFGVADRYTRVEDLLDAGGVDCVVAACPPSMPTSVATSSPRSRTSRWPGSG